jgi:hypothetical protein
VTRTSAIVLLVFVGGCVDRTIHCEEGLHDQIVVFSAWHHEVVLDDGLMPRAAGFDLDDRVSDGTYPNCTDEMDYTSSLRGTPAIDNQYAANLLPLLMNTPELADGPDPLILEQLLRGELVFGLEVLAGPDGAPLVALLELAPVAAMTADASGGALAPSQRFRIVRRERIAARCVDRRAIELALPTFDAPMGDPIVAVPLHDVRMHVTLTPTGELDEGELGARYPVSFAVEVGNILGLGIDESTVRAIGAPDLDPTVDPLVCDSISFGVGFDVAPATVVP